MSDLGQYIKSLDGHATRVHSMELVHNYVWSGSGSGTLIIHDAKVSIAVVNKKQNSNFISQSKLPGKHTEEDFVTAIAFIDGNLWCGSVEGTIYIYSASV